jgi:uncharacterized protein with von Willebrand factor type A (vWA) domain
VTVVGNAVLDLVGFAGRLRADGLPVDMTRVSSALRALAAYQPLRDEDIYWATRLTMCSRPADVPVFNSAYTAWFGMPPPDAGSTPVRSATDGVVAVPLEDVDPDSDPATGTRGTRAGYTERLALPSPWTLTEVDRNEIARFLEAFIGSLPMRPTMRHISGGRTFVDMSRTARGMMRTGCEPVHLWYRRRSHTRRRLVLLLDVSESMQVYRNLNLLLRFAYAAVAAGPKRTEVFTIGTRLDRITGHLRQIDPQAAMDALAGRCSDWNAGTRLGVAMTTFVHAWGGNRAVRSANVVLVSDGWERTDPAPLVRQVARLSRLAYRVIWADPQASEPYYAPQAPSLTDCLPYVQLVPANDGAALRSLAALLRCTACGLRCRRHRDLWNWRV